MALTFGGKSLKRESTDCDCEYVHLAMSEIERQKRQSLPRRTYQKSNAINMDPKISLGSFQFLPSSVTVHGKPEIEEWIGPFQFALWCQRASPWWIGDMLLAGDAQFGEDFSQACEGLISGDQLQRYESIARRVPPRNRLSSLSWSAHAAVARLPVGKQKRLLLDAEQHGWSSEVLRIKVRDMLS